MSKKLSAPTPRAGRWYISDRGEDKARFILMVGWSDSGSIPLITIRERIVSTGKEGFVLTQTKMTSAKYRAYFQHYAMQSEGWEPAWLAGVKKGASCVP
jgi:hypothetical protein